MNVVIVGGGIVGCSSALALAERGASVVVCEKASIGGGSTERSAGGIRAQFSTRINVELSVESMRVWETFDDQFDADIDHRRNGYLFLARSPETAAEFEETVAMQRDCGVPTELLEPEDAREYCPGLEPEHFRAATYSPTDGFADPHSALQAYARAAAEAGAEIRTKTPVLDVLERDGRVIGVETDDGRLGADFVVNAAGPWARRLAKLAGVSLPIAPKRRQMVVVEPETPVPESDPLTVDLESGSYFKPEREGEALVGGVFDGPDPDADPDGFATSIDFDWAAETVEAVSGWTSYFGPETRIREGWAGLYAVTPDHHAILEETVPGLITAAGFSGHGFQHAPATGKIVAELILDGEASLVDVSALSSDRFEGNEALAERNVV